MSNLLPKVLEAHGGQERYDAVSAFAADIAYGGPFWEFKGHPDFAVTDRVEADLHSQKIRLHQTVTGRTVEFDREANLVTVT
jgi:hypothetical protein